MHQGNWVQRMWKVNRISLCVYLQIILLTSCASQLSLVEGTLDNGIRVDITARQDLNYYNGQAHSLHLAMYELDRPAPFRAMINNNSDRRTLLEGDWAHKSVKASQILSIQPNENRKVVFDRAQDSRYLGVVAGFYEKNGDANQVKLYSIDVYSKKFYWKKSKPRQLLVRLNLGRVGFSD